jgi:hypothetical protein
MGPIDQIVAGHQTPRFGNFDSNLKRLQVDFPENLSATTYTVRVFSPQSSLADIGIHGESSRLTFIRSKVLDRCTDTFGLKAFNVEFGQPASQQRVFRK